MIPKILIAKPENGYSLIDSGNNQKLEQFGDVLMVRPDPQALWHKSKSQDDWNNAQARFIQDGKESAWKIESGVPKKWTIEYGKLRFAIRPSSFKHTGLFPEHAPNWEWIREKITAAKNDDSQRKISILNLFGYTGGASLAAAQAGADVCHVDGSKVAIGWAKENAELSNLADKPIRWILDDAYAFVKREIRRGNKYDGIIMDPPAFGHGPDGEVWKIEEDFLNFLDACSSILSEKPLFMLVNGYSAGYSAIAYQNSLLKLKEKYGGVLEGGELTIQEKDTERLLPAGIFGRWSAF